jgi:hypothetical protein
MKKLFLLACFLICFSVIAVSQTVYLSDIKTKEDIRFEGDFASISIDYWWFDSCLYVKRICKYNSSTAVRMKVYQDNDFVKLLYLRSNKSGYKSKHMDDSLTYYFYPGSSSMNYVARKIWIDKGSNIKDDIYIFKIDTLKLAVIDTLLLKNPGLIKKIFGRELAKTTKALRIFVLKSVDTNGSIMLHYWVENIGIVKLTDEKCWRYSFEMSDNRTRPIEKLFEKIMLVIKGKYKDPYWTGEPCYFE